MNIHLFVLLSLLLPIPVPMIAIIVAALYGLTKYPILIWQQLKQQHLYNAFFAFSTIISLGYRNWAGITVIVCIFTLYLYLLYLYQDMTTVLFEKMTTWLLWGSFAHALYAFLQHIKLFFGPDYNAWHSSMISWRDGRADSVFLNPNYYAFMCIIYILIAFYKIQSTKVSRFYMSSIIVNVLGIIFTQSRTALNVAVVVSFIFLYYSVTRYQRKWVNIAVMWTIIAAPLLQFLPRFDLQTIIAHLVDIRFEIWDMAFVMFQKHWLFGTGPFSFLTYFNHYYTGTGTQHAHNLYVDSLLNYGVVGCLLLVMILTHLANKTLDKRLNNKPLSVLGVSLIALVLLHGILDVSIVFIHTLSIFGILMIYITKKDSV